MPRKRTPCADDCELSSLHEPLWLVSPGSPVTYGRNDMPAVLADAFYWHGLLEHVGRDRLRAMIGDAWTSAEFPTRTVDTDTWHDMFTAVGFVTDCRRLRVPRVARTLWRGCLPGFEAGMSWTDDLARAQWFAKRTAFRVAGHVVSAVVPADMVLARFVHGREESEWVLDPQRVADLDIRQHVTA